ncbi:Acyl-CoA dehydrogenase [Jatrophihabitans endophyticus]|uniref:Acyl-CoA dehydrogenase n=1 Tax=Jatrophihabitans endophyticus TaxID=1206085 RepID=A0A1M5DQT7_9ACTN|nr:acyl-CoA dehydrogenase family protein [Jatrophihabitans endophyticus]SHF69347.1 Acyl-CoA dehydrogenase [Jatrophihabitans endophyticus]
MSEPSALTEVQAAVRAFAQRARTDAVAREREHGAGDPVVAEVFAELVADLLATGIGRVRVPRRFGGAEGHVADLGALLVEVATADSNLAQIVRGHLGFVEFLLQRGDDPVTAELLTAAGRGEFFGPAASSPGAAAAQRAGDGPPALTDGVWLHDEGAGLRLSGVKYYTTGSLFADWINVLVPDGDGFVEVVVRRHDPGVTVVDDWSGFGQRLTASGTARFDAVPVRADLVLPHTDPALPEFLGAFYQFVHSATQAGITRRAADDLAALVKGRRRSYPLAAAPEPRHDPQVLAVVGEVASRALTTRATVLALGAALDAYLAAVGESRDAALERAVVESAATQVVNSRLAGEAGWLLFDAGSAGALDTALALDRHWRNARTVSSHNPSIYKARLVGEYLVNGTLSSTRPAPPARVG